MLDPMSMNMGSSPPLPGPLFQPFQRDFAVIAVKLARDIRYPDANSEAVARSIVRKIDGDRFTSAAAWAQQNVIDNPDWLLKIANRHEDIRKNKGKGAVILSFGEGYESLVLIGEKTKVPARSYQVPKISITLSVATIDAENDESLMATFGFVRPSDSLFEHVAAGIDAAQSERDVRVYIQTDFVRWNPVNRMGEESRKNAFRLWTYKDGTVARADEIAWDEIFFEDLTMQTGHAAQAAAAIVSAATANKGRSASLGSHSSDAKPAAKPTAASRKASIKVPVVKKGKSVFDDGWSTGDDSETKNVKALGYTFRPREIIILTKAFRGEELTEEEIGLDTSQFTSKEKRIAERINKKAVKELLDLKESAKNDAISNALGVAAEIAADNDEGVDAKEGDEGRKSGRSRIPSRAKSKEEKKGGKESSKRSKKEPKTKDKKGGSDSETEHPKKKRRSSSKSKAGDKRSKK